MSLDTYYTLGHSGLRVSRIALGAMTFGNDWAEEVMRAFDDLVQSGKVRHIGLSDTPAWYAARAQTLAEWHDYAPIINLQLEYSLVERNIEREFIPLGLELGMGVTVWSPLANGLLTGKYRQQDGTFSGSGRMESQKDNRNPAFQKFNQRNWEIVPY